MITYGMISPLAMVNVEFLTTGDINDLLDFQSLLFAYKIIFWQTILLVNMV